MLETLHALGIIFFHSLQGIDQCDSLIFLRPEILHKMLCKANEKYSNGMDIEILKGIFSGGYLSRSIKIRNAFSKLLLQLKLAVKTPDRREVLLHSLPNGPAGNPNEMPSSVDPLFVKFDGMGYVPEVFFIEIAGRILENLKKKHTSCVSITLNYMRFNILTYQLHMYRRNDCIEFRFQHNDFDPQNRMTEGEKLKYVQPCQDVLKAIRSSLNESSKEAHGYYGSYTFGFKCSVGEPVDGKAFAEYDEQHDCFFHRGQPIRMLWSQKIWFASPPPDVSRIDRCFTLL